MRTRSPRRRRQRATLAVAVVAGLPALGRPGLAPAAGPSFTNNDVYTAPPYVTTGVGTISGTGTTVIDGGTTVLVADAVNQGTLNVSNGGTLTLDTSTTSTVTAGHLFDATIGGSAASATATQATPAVLNLAGASTLGNVNLRTGLSLVIGGATTEGGDNIAGDANTSVTVAAGGSLTYVGPRGLYVSVPLNNNGLVSSTGTGAGLNILAGGTHQGTFAVAAGSSMAVNGTFTASSVVNDSGTFDLAPYLSSGNTFGGTLNVAAGGTLLVDGTTTVLPTATVNVANGTPLGDAVTAQGVTFNNPQTMNFGPATLTGTIVFNNPGLSFASLTYATPGETGAQQLTINTPGTVAIGTLALQGAQLQTGSGTTLAVTTLNLSGGSLRANVTVSGALNYTGGQIDGGDGTQGSVTVLTGATFDPTANVALTRGGQLILDPDTTTTATNGLFVGVGSPPGALTSAVVVRNAATLNVTGKLAIGNNGNVSSGSGNGIVTVQAGGLLTADLDLQGNTNGGDGTLVVGGTAVIGGVQVNDVNVQPGGSLTVPTATIPGAETDPELTGAIVAGYQRDGTLNVSGGTVTAPAIKLGITAGYTGTYVQTGGTVTVNTLGDGNNGNQSTGMGTGIARVMGGMLNAGTVILGSVVGGGGTMVVSGGAIVNVSGGIGAGGTLTLNGGTLTVTATPPPAGEDPELYQAVAAGYLLNGSLSQNGATLSTPYLKLGITAGRTGTYAQTAGTTTITTGLYVGADANASGGSGVGVVTLTGGSTTAAALFVGSANGGTGTVTVGGTGRLTVTGPVAVLAGSGVTITAGGRVTLAARGAGVTADAVAGLNLSGGTLDVSDRAVVLPGASLATVTARAAQAFAGGAWTGVGLTSGTANADGSHLSAVGVVLDGGLYTTFVGRPVSAADVLVRLTDYGDTNLDGAVTAADFTRLDVGAVNHLSGWANGDFNYDGVVDGSDYALADNAFNRQGSAAAPSATPAAAVAAVPEPTSLAALAGFALLARRRGRVRSARLGHGSAKFAGGRTGPRINANQREALEQATHRLGVDVTPADRDDTENPCVPESSSLRVDSR